MPRQTRGNRKKQIVAVLAVWRDKFNVQKATSHQIAAAIGIKPSTYLNNMLWEMSAEGILMPETDNTNSGVTRFNWKIMPGWVDIQQYIAGMFVPVTIEEAGSWARQSAEPKTE